MSTTAPEKNDISSDEEVVEEKAPLLVHMDKADADVPAPINQSPDPPPTISGLRLQFPITITVGILGLIVLIFWRISSWPPRFPKDLREFLGLSPRWQLAPDPMDDYPNDIPKNDVYQPWSWSVVSNDTYQFPADAKHIYFAGYCNRLQGETLIKAAHEGTSLITVETRWKTRDISKWREMDTKVVNNTDNISLSFDPRGDSCRQLHAWVRMTIHLPRNRHYAWTESRTFSQSPYSWSVDISDLTSYGITFERMSLMTGNGGILSAGVTAKRLDARSDSGNIIGHFDVPEDQLILESRLGRVIRN